MDGNAFVSCGIIRPDLRKIAAHLNRGVDNVDVVQRGRDAIDEYTDNVNAGLIELNYEISGLHEEKFVLVEPKPTPSR